MKVAIVGSREYPNMKQVLDFVASLPEYTEVVSGGARGVDTFAQKAAEARWDLDISIFPADWNRHGKGAGYIRNREIVEYADYVVAFWDGKSSGTKHTIKLAKEWRAGNKLAAVYGPDDVAVWKSQEA